MTRGDRGSRLIAWSVPSVGMFFVITATMKAVDFATGAISDEDLAFPLSIYVLVTGAEALLGASLMMRPDAHPARYGAMGLVVAGACATFALELLGSEGSCGCFGMLTPVLGDAKFAISAALLALLAIPGVTSQPADADLGDGREWSAPREPVHPV